jgi:hypothetical protein
MVQDRQLEHQVLETIDFGGNSYAKVFAKRGPKRLRYRAKVKGERLK